MARMLLKVINVFHDESSALFMVTCVHNIRKSTKNRNSETRWKTTENSRLKKFKRLRNQVDK